MLNKLLFIGQLLIFGKHNKFTCGLENTRVTMAVALSEGFHHAVDLLGFSWQTETPQELPDIKHTFIQQRSDSLLKADSSQAPL